MRVKSKRIRSIPQTFAGWLRLEDADYKWLALIVSVGLVIRVVWILMFQATPGDDALAYDNLAWRLANGQGYVDADGYSTAFWPVGYPAFLAALYVVFGHSWTAAGIANALVGTLSVILTYKLSREVLSSRLALLAAAAVALLPSHVIAYTSTLRNETLHTALVLIVMIATSRLMRSPTWKNAALLGFMIGVSVYVRPILLLFPVVVALLIMIRGGGEVQKLGRLGGVSSVGLFADDFALDGA